MATANDLTGQRFGRLVALERVGSDKNRKAIWLCKCDCGNTITTTGTLLKNGRTKSCGCLQRERAKEAKTKHGNLTHSGKCPRLYRCWQSMKKRCYNTNAKDFSFYGGRGVSVCDEWRDNYTAFEAWAIANGYSDNLTIDRIDTNGDYSPNNCRWVTMAEQANNKRNNMQITHNGKTQTLAQWAKEKGIKQNTLFQRLKRSGWNIEKALNTGVCK